MSTYVLSILLAVVACVVGGTLGGMILARPQTMLELAGLTGEEERRPSLLTEGRALGGALIGGHALAALYLGYQPRIGAAMALALALAWLGAAVGRAASLWLDGLAERRPTLGAITLNLLIGVCLALPFFQIGRIVVRGVSLA